MASFAGPLSQPPMQPPNVTAQTGGGTPDSASQVGAMFGNKLQNSPDSGQASPKPGEVHPQGALLARSEAVQQVLTEMGQMDPDFAPWAAKAVALVKSGLDAVMAKKSQGPPPVDNTQSSQESPKANPTFPG